MWMVLGIAIGLIVGISLSKLSKKPEHFNSNYKEAFDIVQQFVKNRILHSDTSNFRLFSKSSLEKWGTAGITDAVTWASYIQIADPIDTAEIAGIVLRERDTARVFVGQSKGDNFVVKVYQFIKELKEWKFSGYEFDYESEWPENTPEGLLK